MLTAMQASSVPDSRSPPPPNAALPAEPAPPPSLDGTRPIARSVAFPDAPVAESSASDDAPRVRQLRARLRRAHRRGGASFGSDPDGRGVCSRAQSHGRAEARPATRVGPRRRRSRRQPHVRRVHGRHVPVRTRGGGLRVTADPRRVRARRVSAPRRRRDGPIFFRRRANRRRSRDGSFERERQGEKRHTRDATRDTRRALVSRGIADDETARAARARVVPKRDETDAVQTHPARFDDRTPRRSNRGGGGGGGGGGTASPSNRSRTRL